MALQDFDFCSAYIDDNQVFSRSYSDHLRRLELVFDRMIQVNMKLNPNKCTLFSNKLEFLGFEVSTRGIAPIQSKVEAILKLQEPKDKTCVRAFLNTMVGFYRRHIPQFAQRTFALTNLLKKNAPFVWTPNNHQLEFNGLKEALVNAAMLVYPNPSQPYSVYCDASDIRISAVLCQSDVPVCFVSRKLKPAEINYPIVEKELLAIVYACFKLRRYLLDRKFTVYTDNMTAKYPFTKKEPNTRLQRWCLSLQEYDFEIRHVDGNKNPSDYCSRYPLVGSHHDSHDGEEILDQLFLALVVIDIINKVDYEEELKQLCRCLARCLDPSTPQEVFRKLEVQSARPYYMMGDDHHLLYRLVGNASDQCYVKIPFQSERPGILVEVHDGYGHFGINST